MSKYAILISAALFFGCDNKSNNNEPNPPAQEGEGTPTGLTCPQAGLVTVTGRVVQYLGLVGSQGGTLTEPQPGATDGTTTEQQALIVVDSSVGDAEPSSLVGTEVIVAIPLASTDADGNVNAGLAQEIPLAVGDVVTVQGTVGSDETSNVIRASFPCNSVVLNGTTYP